MEKFFLRTSLSILILLFLINSNDIPLISGENFNHFTFVNNNNSLNVSNRIYDVDSNPFDVSYADWTEKWGNGPTLFLGIESFI